MHFLQKAKFIIKNKSMIALTLGVDFIKLNGRQWLVQETTFIFFNILSYEISLKPCTKFVREPFNKLVHYLPNLFVICQMPFSVQYSANVAR